MSTFEEIRSKHNQLLELQQSNVAKRKMLTSVNDFMTIARESGTQIHDPVQRDQIRTFLRYWASLIYDSTPGRNKKFPNTDLLPYAGSPVKSRLGLWWIAGIIGVLIIIAVTIFIIFFPTESPIKTPTPTSELEATLATLEAIFANTVNAEATSNAEAIQTITAAALISPSVTTSPTIEPPTNTPEPPIDTPVIDTPTVTPALSLFLLSSPMNGDEITPDLTLKGTYENLRKGRTLHVLLQPLSGTGNYYPIKEYFTVPDDMPSGEWEIHTNLGTQFDISRPDTYIITLILVSSDDVRIMLDDAVKTGMGNIPGEADYIDNTPITVTRDAFKYINETRVVYAAQVGDKPDIDLFCIKPDGTDPQQITFTADLSETFPEISPDGKQIAFIGISLVEQQKLYSLWVVDSNGKNARKIIEEQGVIYENPSWSPDGKFVAYSALQTLDENTAWTLYLVDMSDIFTLTPPSEYPDISRNQSAESNKIIGRYPTWMGNDTIIFSRQTEENIALYSLNINDLKVEPFFDYDGLVRHPAVSPDGNWLAFMHYSEKTDGNRDIYITNIFRRGVIRLTESAATEWFPAWGPESKWVFFEQSTDSTHAIWKVAIDGSGMQLVTPKGIAASSPSVGLINTFLSIDFPGQ